MPRLGRQNSPRTERVNVSSNGAQDDQGTFGTPAISANGRFVAFQSSGTNLVAGDTNGADDVFVRNRKTGTTERVSVGSAGKQGQRRQQWRDRSISADGRFVAFNSLRHEPRRRRHERDH